MTRRTRRMIATALTLVAVLALSGTVGLVVGLGRGASNGVETVDASHAYTRTVAGAEDAADADGSVGSEDFGGAADTGREYAAVPSGSPSSAHHLRRTGDLSLLVARGGLLLTVDRIKDGTTALGGYVMSSNVGGWSDGRIEPLPLDVAETSLEAKHENAAATLSPDRYATLVVRVPEQKFDAAIKRLSRLGDVQNTSTSSEDVTFEYVDLQARLRHHRAVESRLVGFLQETTTVNQMLAVQDRIDEVQLTIEELTAQLKSLREQTSYGTLTIHVSEKDVAAAVHSSDTFGGTFWNSVTLLRDGARITGLVLTALLPFATVAGAVAAAVWYVARRLSRSRRRSTDAVPSA